MQWMVKILHQLKWMMPFEHWLINYKYQLVTWILPIRMGRILCGSAEGHLSVGSHLPHILGCSSSLPSYPPTWKLTERSWKTIFLQKRQESAAKPPLNPPKALGPKTAQLPKSSLVKMALPGVSMTLKNWGHHPKLMGHGPIFLSHGDSR